MDDHCLKNRIHKKKIMDDHFLIEISIWGVYRVFERTQLAPDVIAVTRDLVCVESIVQS